MATQKTVKKPNAKGKGLTKKVGPFPLYFYLIGVALVIFYLYYRHKSSASSANSYFQGSLDQQTIPSGVVIPSSHGDGTSTQDTGSVGSTNSDLQALIDSGLLSSPNNFPTNYATQTDLASAVDNVNNQTAAAIAGITFPQPTVNITVPHESVASTTTKSKTAAKKSAVVTAAKHIKYYTLKKQVPLRGKQTLHFAKGKGYYAA